MKRLLVVGADGTAGQLRSFLAEDEYAVFAGATPSAALERASRESVDIILCDIDALGAAGAEFVARYVAAGGPAAILAMGAGRLEGAVLAAVRAGASGHLVTPLQPEEVRLALRNVDERQRLRREVAELRIAAQDAAIGGGLVVESPVMRQLVERAGRAAGGSAPILLIGERGAGKEAVARFIHRASRRAEGRFVVVDLTAVPPARIEPVLFGDASGHGRGGLVAEAGGGTLLLDGVDRLPAPAQERLLAAVDGAGTDELDSSRPGPRLIAATSGSLDDLVRTGAFRADLFERLRAQQFTLPPLRDRREDIPSLATHFLALASARVGRPFSLAPRALGRLTEYVWPGNVSELREVMERAAVLAIGNVIDVGDLALGGARAPATAGAEALRSQVESAERTAITRALSSAAGNRRTAAHALGISLRTLFYKLRRYDLD